jgi:hypothetical protein
VSYFQEHLLLYNAFNGILFMIVKAHLQVRDYCLCKIWTNKSKAAGKTTMLIMELEWRMHLVKTSCKANFTYMRGTDWYATNYDDPEETEVM